MSSQDFFCIRRDFINEICDLGMNEAVAMIVLLCFSDRSNTKSSASVNAIEKYGGVGRLKAKKVLVKLQELGHLEKIKGGTKPRYEIKGNSGRSNELIFLPKETVVGAEGSIYSPIAQFRQTQNPTLLKVFLNLYYYQYLADHGGVDRSVLHQPYCCEKVYEYAQFTLWTAVGGQNWDFNNGLFGLDIEDSVFFESVNRLIEMRFYEVLIYITESSSVDSELIGPYTEYGDEFETKIFKLSEGKINDLYYADKIPSLDRYWREGDVLLAPKSYEGLHVFGILRSRFRPKNPPD